MTDYELNAWRREQLEAALHAKAVGREQEFRERFLSQEVHGDTVALPTGGLFAEAVLGESNAADVVDDTRAWRWDGDTIPISPTAIEELKSRTREGFRMEAAGELGPAMTSLPDPNVNAQMPDAAALAKALSKSGFRDMSGGDTLSALV